MAQSQAPVRDGGWRPRPPRASWRRTAPLRLRRDSHGADADVDVDSPAAPHTFPPRIQPALARKLRKPVFSVCSCSLADIGIRPSLRVLYWMRLGASMRWANALHFSEPPHCNSTNVLIGNQPLSPLAAGQSHLIERVGVSLTDAPSPSPLSSDSPPPLFSSPSRPSPDSAPKRRHVLRRVSDRRRGGCRTASALDAPMPLVHGLETSRSKVANRVRSP